MPHGRVGRKLNYVGIRNNNNIKEREGERRESRARICVLLAAACRFSSNTSDSCICFPSLPLSIVSKDKSQIDYLSRRFFLRNLFVAAAAAAVVDDDDAEPAVEHVSVVKTSGWIECLSSDGNEGELGCTSLGMMGNNLISLGRGVGTLSALNENAVDSDDCGLPFEPFGCLEHQ